MQQKITCPYCFEDFAPQDIKFRCIEPTCPARSPDPIFASFRDIAVQEMGYVLIPPRRYGNILSNRMACDACKKLSFTRLCPNCHFELSQDVGQIDQYIIAIIGGASTGKSNYIASLIYRLQFEIGLRFDIAVEMMGEETQERWQRDFYEPLFVKKKVVQKTNRARSNLDVRSPLMFRFMFNQGKRTRALTISFFDSAGEDMEDLSQSSPLNRYICHAHGIIFLLDPLQIPLVRNQLPSRVQNVVLPPENWRTSPERIVGGLRNLFAREYNLPPTQKITVPVAFTLSKIDMLKPILDDSSALRRRGIHPGRVNLGDLQTISNEVSSNLSEWINPAFLNNIRHNFANFGFFGVSALGEQPDANDQLQNVSPQHVEDPFLWLLYVLGLVDGKKK